MSVALMKTSNLALKPLKLTVFAATDADLAQVPKTPTLASQRTPKEFRNPTIKTDRPLRRDPAYKPELPNTPIVVTDLAISLSPEECANMIEGHSGFPLRARTSESERTFAGDLGSSGEIVDSFGFDRPFHYILEGRYGIITLQDLSRLLRELLRWRSLDGTSAEISRNSKH
jgi:hypothetical protein